MFTYVTYLDLFLTLYCVDLYVLFSVIFNIEILLNTNLKPILASLAVAHVVDVSPCIYKYIFLIYNF